MDIKNFIFMILRRWPVIVISAIVGTLLFYVYSSVFMKPIYSTTATMIVNKVEDPTSTQSYNYNDVLMTQKIVKTYSIIMVSNNVMSGVINKLKINMSASQLKSYVKVQGMGETEVLQITVENPDRDLATNIANAITEVAQEKIMDITKAASVEVIDKAEVPTVPVKPNKMQYGFLGAVLGLILSAGIIILQDFFDDTFKTEEDIRTFLELPILTVLPEIQDEKAVKD